MEQKKQIMPHTKVPDGTPWRVVVNVLHLQIVVARLFGATFVQLDVVCACCVLGVSWPRLVPCVLANRFVCVSSNRSVCKFKTHGAF